VGGNQTWQEGACPTGREPVNLSRSSGEPPARQAVFVRGGAVDLGPV